MNATVQQFMPIFLTGLMAVTFAAATILLPSLLGKRRTFHVIKESPYECGMPPMGDPRARLSIKFYLVAMLFILFDIEVVFLVGWAFVYRHLARPISEGGEGPWILGAAVLFILLLEAGHYYAWKQGAFDWAPRRNKPTPPEREPAAS